MSYTFDWCADKTRLYIWDKQVFCIGECGDKYWCLNDLLHRENGPALEYINGHKEWYLNDKLHREDGPAIEYGNGDKDWWLNGKHYTEPEYWKELMK